MIAPEPSSQSRIDPEEELRANREHDRKYGWNPQYPTLYQKTSFAGAVSACPGINRNGKTSEMDVMVWAWHMGA